tara:strand:- start:301 stop:714 length:414 start_codon:yes stop_codon:yes gene_type:complete
MEGEVFVFEHYDVYSRDRPCLVPLIVEGGKLKEIQEFGSTDPQEITWGESERKLAELLREKGIDSVWTCGGECMYDEVLDFVTHFSGGEGKYAFHYDPVERGISDGITVQTFTGDRRLSTEERNAKWKDLAEFHEGE